METTLIEKPEPSPEPEVKEPEPEQTVEEQKFDPEDISVSSRQLDELQLRLRPGIDS